MSEPLQPQITETGLAAIFANDGTGFSAQITHIGLGTSGYTPDYKQKSLINQVAKIPMAGGEKLSPTLLHFTALADGTAAYWVREVGFYLADGTLLAVWSHPSSPLTYKAANSDLLLAYDLSLAALPADSVTIVSGEAGLSLTVAAPLAAHSAALVAAQLRDLQQQDQLDAQGEKQRITSAVQADLQARLKAVERRQDGDRDGLLSVAVANAASLIALQTIVVQHIHGA
ncbi:phage tail protein [Pseudomonas sp. DCB_CB]|uniref:phage tail-collar fiber domain-containing protein n=1 Tax=unclassified Pseudomonas TaxID=196821 RepID=UPI002248B6E6|nr:MULTISPECIES: phage tail protein [unclassified Pseudomonas]MCX2689616.1 phage tail protein [Pseudomonas sp. DCB_BZ]MCX2854703.1 phage tail protein [Pseudomonas sp. DCB_CB]